MALRDSGNSPVPPRLRLVPKLQLGNPQAYHPSSSRLVPKLELGNQKTHAVVEGFDPMNRVTTSLGRRSGAILLAEFLDRLAELLHLPVHLVELLFEPVPRRSHLQTLFDLDPRSGRLGRLGRLG